MSGHKFSAKGYERLDRPERKKVLPLDEILKAVPVNLNQINVADIGCGTGYLTIPLATKLANQGTVFAIDINTELLAILRERVANLANVRVFHSSENEIPITDDIIDISFMITVFHELKDPLTFLQEIKRISCPSEHRVVVVDWTAQKREQGPPAHRAIARKKTIEYFSQAGYQLEQEILQTPNVYGLVFLNQG